MGKCVILTALSVLLTCCPPAPLALYVSILISESSITISISSSITGYAKIEANDVCLRELESNGDIRHNL